MDFSLLICPKLCLSLAEVSFYGPCSNWRAGHLDQVFLLVWPTLGKVNGSQDALRLNHYFIITADIFTGKNIVIMCVIACCYPFDIPCKLDDVEEIYINVLVPVIIAHYLTISQKK